MASVTLNVAPTITGGTVTVYPQANWPYGTDIAGAPVGSSVTTGTVDTSGSVTLTGLTAATMYVAYQASPDRYVRFRVPNAASSSGSTTGGGLARSYALGLPLVASRNATNQHGTTTLPISTKIAHKAICDCSDLRVMFGPPDGGETDLPNNLNVKAGIQIPVSLTLTSALSTGSPITSLPISTPAAPFPIGTKVKITSGTNVQVWTTTAQTFITSTSVTVTSQTPNFAYPTSSTMTAQVVYPLTFGGKATFTLEYPGGVVLSDPLAVELTAGQTFHTLTYASMPMGAATTLAAASLANATNLSLATALPATMRFPDQINVDSGGNLDSVTMTGQTVTQATLTTALSSGVSSGTSLAVSSLPNALPSGSAFTLKSGANTQTFAVTAAAAVGDTALTVTAQTANFSYPIGTIGSTFNVSTLAVTHAHSAGVAANQLIPTNIQMFGDLGDRLAFSSDLSWVDGTGNTLAGGTTTLSANASAGDTKITLAASVTMSEVAPTIQIDTGGANPETIAVASAGGGNTVYLATPLAFAHTSGATCTGGVYTSPSYGPYAIFAERATSPPKPLLVVGDSIPSGNGNWTRNIFSSFATKALDGVRPYLTGALPSESASSYASDNFSRRRRRLAGLVSGGTGGWAIYEYGTNDVFAGTATATLQAFTATSIAALKQRGLKVAVQTITPRTTSTDNWETTGNQTLLQDQAHENLRLAYNTWVRAGAGGAADLVIDLAATVDSGLLASGAETGLWGAPSGRPLTWDGIHPTVLGHSLMSAAVTAALPSMT